MRILNLFESRGAATELLGIWKKCNGLSNCLEHYYPWLYAIVDIYRGFCSPIHRAAALTSSQKVFSRHTLHAASLYHDIIAFAPICQLCSFALLIICRDTFLFRLQRLSLSARIRALAQSESS